MAKFITKRHKLKKIKVYDKKVIYFGEKLQQKIIPTKSMNLDKRVTHEESLLFSKDSFFKEKLFADDKIQIPQDKVISRMNTGGLQYFTRHINVKNSDENLYLLLAVFELK